MKKPLKQLGKLIIFEGADESGKTTASQALANEIRNWGHECLWIAFPGHEIHSLGAHVYELHHTQKFSELPPLSLQLLHVAAHIEAIQKRILPALKSGVCVVMDRFWWSTWVYGLASGADEKSLQLAIKVEKLEWGNLIPALAFLLVRDLPGKAVQPSERVFHQNLYMKIALRERRRHAVQVVHNEQSLQDALGLVAATTYKKLIEGNDQKRKPKPTRRQKT
jgi:hypothetical protein